MVPFVRAGVADLGDFTFWDGALGAVEVALVGVRGVDGNLIVFFASTLSLEDVFADVPAEDDAV